MTLTKRIIASVLCLATVVASAGCGKKKNDDSLVYWSNLDGSAAAVHQNMGDTRLAAKLQEATGIKVTYQHPPQGQTAEKFSIMTASKELPDIIEYKWADYAGGPSKAISDGKIIDIGEYKQYAPNYFKFLEENPEIEKMVKTDDGKYIGFPFVRNDPSLLVMNGPYVRQDWLDDLGLSMPETIDEWETVLTAFKEKKNASIPLTLNPAAFINGIFTGAYGVKAGFYHDGDVVKFGQYEPAYKEFVAKMADWTQKGLLDENLASSDNKVMLSNLLNDKSGAAFGNIGSGIGNATSSAADKEGFVLKAAPYPVLEKGNMCEYGQSDLPIPGTFAAISTSCENIEAAMKYLDYGYSEEGAMLFNFGIEGESYNMVDGYPKYVDSIVDNQEGLSMANAMSDYCLSYATGPFLQDKRYMEQFAKLDCQKEAWDVWQKTNGANHIMPLVYIADDVTNEYARLYTDITTYADEMVMKFILGVEPMSNYDSFIKNLEQRGIKRLIEIEQEAYNRAIAR